MSDIMNMEHEHEIVSLRMAVEALEADLDTYRTPDLALVKAARGLAYKIFPPKAKPIEWAEDNGWWRGGGYVITPYNDVEISKALCEKNHQQAFRDQLAQ